MSIPPAAPWHAASLRLAENVKHAPHWANSSDVNEIVPLTYWVDAALKKLASNRPARPIQVVTQSSLWDSILAKTIRKANPALNKSVEAVRDWNWIDRASRFLMVIKDANVGIEKIFWRTNPNCPNLG